MLVQLHAVLFWRGCAVRHHPVGGPGRPAGQQPQRPARLTDVVGNTLIGEANINNDICLIQFSALLP